MRKVKTLTLKSYFYQFGNTLTPAYIKYTNTNFSSKDWVYTTLDACFCNILMMHLY